MRAQRMNFISPQILVLLLVGMFLLGALAILPHITATAPTSATVFDLVKSHDSTEQVLTRAAVTGGEVVFHTVVGDITGNLRKASGQFGSPPPQCTWLWDLKIPIPGKDAIKVTVDHCALQDLLDQLRNGDGLPPIISQ